MVCQLINTMSGAIKLGHEYYKIANYAIFYISLCRLDYIINSILSLSALPHFI